MSGGLQAADVDALRRDFPALQQAVYGKPLVYLDNAATSQKPQAVLDRMVRFYREECANIHRGVHALSERATQAYEDARAAVCRFLNAREDREIVFVRGATEAINLVAHSYGRQRVAPGDEIVVTALEHHANLVPWQIVCEERGATLRVAPISDDGVVHLDAYAALLGPRTRLVAVTHVSNVLGTVNPVRRMIELAHGRGIPVLVDGAQAVPHLPVDVQALDCDFYTFSGHKVYGPTGIGVLYGKAALLESLPPYQAGGYMIATVTFERSTYAGIPERFEAGTPHIAGAVGLAAALAYVQAIGLDRIALSERDVLDYARTQLRAIPRLRLIGAPDEQASAVSFLVDGVHPHDVATVLDREGVAIRTGHHCAQPLLRRLGLTATARASLALYNTRADVDALVAGIHKTLEVLG